MRTTLLALLCAVAVAVGGCGAKPKSAELMYEKVCADECHDSYKACHELKGTACGYAEQQCLRTCPSWLVYPDGRRVDLSN